MMFCYFTVVMRMFYFASCHHICEVERNAIDMIDSIDVTRNVCLSYVLLFSECFCAL